MTNLAYYFLVAYILITYPEFFHALLDKYLLIITVIYDKVFIIPYFFGFSSQNSYAG